jgi:hypothetical protein
MSRALEVLRFMISSTVVVCTTGRLAGVAPLTTFYLRRVDRPISNERYLLFLCCQEPLRSVRSSPAQLF